MGPDMGRMGGMNPNMNAPSMGTKNPDQVLSHNPKLSSRLQTLLPTGTDVAKAASGFKNLGQFVSAVHVAHNLNIPFSELKERMISGDSLGQAIHGLKPDVSAKEAAKNANGETKDILHEASY
jgi:hypothetical protein